VSLKNQIDAIAFLIKSDTSSDWANEINGFLFIKTLGNPGPTMLIQQLKKLYCKYDQKTPISYEFLDEIYNASYKNEEKLGNAFIS
jgi:hypothetical protein